MQHSLRKRTKSLVRFVLSVMIGIIVLSPSYAQFTVSGKVVTSEDQSPLPGVNILLKGTTNGTITDSNGEYSIGINSGDDILVFSFVGFNIQEVPVSGRSVIDIILTSDARQLSEVVVTALGIKRED